MTAIEDAERAAGGAEKFAALLNVPPNTLRSWKRNPPSQVYLLMSIFESAGVRVYSAAEFSQVVSDAVSHKLLEMVLTQRTGNFPETRADPGNPATFDHRHFTEAVQQPDNEGKIKRQREPKKRAL